MIKEKSNRKYGNCRFHSLYQLLQHNGTPVAMPYIILLGLDSFFTICEFYYKQMDAVSWCVADNKCDLLSLNNMKIQYNLIHSDNDLFETVNRGTSVLCHLYMNWNKPVHDFNVAPIHSIVMYKGGKKEIYIDDIHGTVILNEELKDKFQNARYIKSIPFEPNGLAYYLNSKTVINTDELNESIIFNLKRVAQNFNMVNNESVENNFHIYKGATAFEKYINTLNQYRNIKNGNLENRLFRVRMYILLKSFSENPHFRCDEYENAMRYFGLNEIADIMHKSSIGFQNIYNIILNLKSEDKKNEVERIIYELNKIYGFSKEISSKIISL